MAIATAPTAAQGKLDGRLPNAGACWITRSTIAKINGSHDAAAMIMGNTTETSMKPLNCHATPANKLLSGRSPSVRMKMNMNTPANPSWITVNQP